MASDSEPAKLLLPYLQRADELQKHEPLVAYYCRLYAMEKGLRIPQSERTKTTNALLISIMNQLEKDKKSLKLGPEDGLYLEGFALNVFGKADKQDRAGRADLNTAKTFYAASIFFEVLSQLGPLHPELEQKQKYAIWKAADIRKALKEGRKPTPGPPGGDDDLSVPSSTPGGSYNGVASSETAPTSPGHGSDPSPSFHNEVKNYHSPSIPPAPKFHDNVNNQTPKFHDNVNNQTPQFHDNVNNQTPQFHDDVNGQYPTNIPPSPPSYPSSSFPPHDLHQPPPPTRPENSTHYQPYHHESYPQEPNHHLPPHTYPSHEPPPPYSYPNFQSYPSFAETTLPSVPSHPPASYYQGSDPNYSTQVAPPTTTQYSPSSRNGAVPEPAPTSAQTYQYDCNYEPPPEKIAEAHKAARFAVGALAFDDVSIAVDFLKKSLELLTNPSAGQ